MLEELSPPDYFESEKKLIELVRSVMNSDAEIFSVSFRVVRLDGEQASYERSRRFQDDPAITKDDA